MRPFRAIALFAVVLVLYYAFRLLGHSGSNAFGDEWSEGLLKTGVWVVPCLLVLRFSRRMGYGQVLRELGLIASPLLGYAFGFLATLPMHVLAFQHPLTLEPSVILSSVIFGCFAEELLFRGFLFRQLVRSAGWPVSTAILTSALAFGLAHLGNVAVQDTRSVMFAIGEVGMTAAGGALFGWLTWRTDSLWPAVGLHTFMNLWWEVFGVEDWSSEAQAGATAIGPSVANLARIASIVVAVWLVHRWKSRRPSMF